MYTGVRRDPTPEGLLQNRQTQCLSIGDGMGYEKLNTNPVLAENDLPEGDSAIDFRDLKIWREQNGSYRAVIGNRCPDESGAILLFHGDNTIA